MALRTIRVEGDPVLGSSVHFEPNFRCEFGFNISIGNNFFANFDCIMLDGNLITIGVNVLLGPRVGLYTANHALDPQERLMGGCYAHPIVIEDNVWVGAGVHIMGGVTVGRNSVIGAGSVVTKSIPENVIACSVLCLSACFIYANQLGEIGRWFSSCWSLDCEKN